MISIIIPTYNEAAVIANSIAKIRQTSAGISPEIIVVDGGSTDDTIAIAEAEGVTVVKGPKGRARQMNYGASISMGEVLYFLHADSIPPANFSYYILDAGRKGASSGCFRLTFDYDHWFLKANSWFTRFSLNAVRFGDQSLFVTKEVFSRSGGFREDLMVMEDQEIIHRLKKQGKFVVMNAAVTTSARKYLENGIYRMQGIFFRIWALYYLGYSQEQLLRVYKRLIRKHKL
jgi:rSAM/selenodomain-associated transferase 2